LAKDELKELFVNNPQLKDVVDNDPAGIKEIRLSLNENAYLLGLNLRDVMAQVRAGFFGSQAQRFQRGQDEIRVWVRYDRSNRSSITDLDDMRILTPTGNRIPLSEIASYTIKRGDVAINHLDGQQEIQISADLKDPDNSDVTQIIASIKEVLQEDILSKVTIAFTFRSYSQPFLLLLLVPFSLPAVAWGHWIHGFPVNILSMLGIIALIGIMVNDGLVLIGKFNSNLRSGMKFDTAIYEAGRSRFRAIFLTSITTIAGLAPLIFETSRQAQFLIPMAISIAYGIGFATILTLILLPIFLSFNNFWKREYTWLFANRPISKEEFKFNKSEPLNNEQTEELYETQQ